MSHNIPNLFDVEDDPGLTDRLCQKVMIRIKTRQMVLFKAKLALYGSVFALALAGFVPTAKFLKQSLTSTGLFSYVSLLFSDTYYALANWKCLLLSIANSFPVIGASIALTLILVCMSAWKEFSKYRNALDQYKTI